MRGCRKSRAEKLLFLRRERRRARNLWPQTVGYDARGKRAAQTSFLARSRRAARASKTATLALESSNLDVRFGLAVFLLLWRSNLGAPEGRAEASGYCSSDGDLIGSSSAGREYGVAKKLQDLE